MAGKFQLDEGQMHLGAALHVEAATRFLEQLRTAGPGSRIGCSKVSAGDDAQPHCGLGTDMADED